ncbi:MAG TPA: acyl-CoA-binding protein [Candidatus Hydrogenedentes bacterium]|nr:acyl-CoA-binding protein [Candidatus Hydrogenedentota bacterium]
MDEALQARFSEATESIRTLSKPPSGPDLLKLYSLFKQATQGDCQGKRPGITEFVQRAKFDAWKAIEGTRPEEAMHTYIAFVDELLQADTQARS